MILRNFMLAVAAASILPLAAQSASDSLPETDAARGFGTNLSFEITTPSGSHGRWSTGSGADVTVDYTFSLAPNWYVAPGIGGYYTTMNVDFIPEENSVYKGSIRNWGIRIPVYMGYNLDLSGDFALSFASGPQLNINLYARELTTPDFSGNVIHTGHSIDLFEHGFNRVDLQWGFFCGVTYKKHYRIGLRGSVGLTNTASVSDGARHLDIRRNNIAFILSYKF